MARARQFGCDAPRTKLSVRREHLAEFSSGVLPGAFEIIGKTAAAFGVTPLMPFTDRRLIEYCLAIPATQKYRDDWTRVILRRGLRDFLPPKIQNRYGKKYLNRVFERSLFVLAEPELTEFVEQGLDIASPYLNLTSIQESYQRIRRQSSNGTPSTDASMNSIWSAVLLAKWVQTHADRVVAA